MTNFNVFILCVFLVINAVSCAKKKTESEETTQPETETVVKNEFPIMAGRSLDSLKTQKYSDRVLAFSIELGHRSNDFNRRFAMILRAGSGGDWQKAIRSSIELENYKAAEKYNMDYLDSLRRLIIKPPAEFNEHLTALTNSYDRLCSNYALIRNFASFKNMPAILDTVLSNEFVIKGSLRSFEEYMRTVTNKKLPN